MFIFLFSVSVSVTVLPCPREDTIITLKVRMDNWFFLRINVAERIIKMFEQDYVMRMIKEIASVLAKILFNSESETIEEDLLEELFE